MIVQCSSLFNKSSSNSNRRRTLEKARIHKLKHWHENVKKIARSEMDFIASIFKDEDENVKNSEDRDWLRDDETDIQVSEGEGAMVKKDT
jgi:hypothetical protein